MKVWTARDIHNLKSSGTSRSWYEIKNKVENGAPTQVMLYDEIGGWGVYASDFISDISAIKGPIDLHISSEGGEVFEGVNIYNALKARGNVTAYVDSLAASIATVIAMGADRVVMAKTARMMIHDASGASYGNAKDMYALAELLDSISNTIAEVYADKAGGEVSDWRAAMQSTTWFTAQEAVDAGLADEILGGESEPKQAPAAKATTPNVVNEIPDPAGPEVDNDVETSITSVVIESPIQEPEAFDFAAFSAGLNAAKEAIARG